jgi:hypothetical protein
MGGFSFWFGARDKRRDYGSLVSLKAVQMYYVLLDGTKMQHEQLEIKDKKRLFFPYKKSHKFV